MKIELVSVFNLVDKCNFNMLEIHEMAMDAAKRRGEVEGYEPFEVEVSIPVEKSENEYWYQIKVFGRNYGPSI